MASTKYQQLISTGQVAADTGTNNYNDNNALDTSLQPYDSNSDSLSHSNISINKQEDGSQYHSIESYNKNSLTKPVISQPQQPPSNQQQSLSNIPGTPTRRGVNDYTRSSSPIPVLLRSASSILSQSMRLPPGSLRASTFTVITGMVGGGTFTFSYGIYKSGMIPGLIYLIIISSLAGYTTYSIVWCAEQNNCPSFRQLAKKLYSSKFAMFIQICLSLLLWMACISYMTLTKNLLHSAIRNLLNSNSSNEWYDNDILLLLIASIIPTYLALQRKVSALRYASLFGLIVVLFSMCLVVITYMNWCKNKNINDENDPGFDRKCFDKSISHEKYLYNDDILGHTYTIALFFGGFAAQFTVLPIYFEMQKRSPQNMQKCIASGFGVTFIIYLIVAFFGYFTFPNLTDPKNDQNLITLYKNDTAMLIVQILMALYVMSIIPLFAHAFRKSINELIFARKKKKHKKKKKHAENGNVINEKPQKIINLAHSSSNSLNNSSASLSSYSEISTDETVNDREIIEDAVTNPHLAYVPVSPDAKKFVKKTIEKRERKGEKSPLDEMELPTMQHAILTLVFLASVFGVAIFAQNIGQVNSIISSTTLPIVCFIFPAMCTIKTKGASLRMKVLSSIMALLSLLNAIMFFVDMFTGM